MRNPADSFSHWSMGEFGETEVVRLLSDIYRAELNVHHPCQARNYFIRFYKFN